MECAHQTVLEASETRTEIRMSARDVEASAGPVLGSVAGPSVTSMNLIGLLPLVDVLGDSNQFIAPRNDALDGEDIGADEVNVCLLWKRQDIVDLAHSSSKPRRQNVMGRIIFPLIATTPFVPWAGAVRVFASVTPPSKVRSHSSSSVRSTAPFWVQ